MLNSRLYGLDDSELVSVTSADERQFLLEADTAAALLKMQQHAAADGVSLGICSAHRSFARQLQIWNAKAQGQRPVLDANSDVIADISKLPPEELLHTLLLWSALPGTSRHHWGTDLDLYDSAAVHRSQLQLVNREYQPGGPCYPLQQWLEQHALNYGFYRPFQAGMSGTSAELWHYSYFPSAQPLLAAFATDELAQLLRHSELALKKWVLAQLPELVDCYVRQVAPIPQH